MFLETLRLETPKKSFDWKSTLVKMQKIDLTKLEWKLEMLVRIMEVSDALKMWRLVDGKESADLRKIDEKFAQALTYSNSEKIVSSLLAQIATELSFDIIVLNWNNFDFDVYKKYLNWEVTAEDFIFNKNWENNSNKAWRLIWKSWKEYTWLKTWDIVSLRQDEILDIIENIKDENYKETIDFLLDEKNLEKIKSAFISFRTAWLSLIREVILNKKWKLTKFIETL